MEQSSDFENLAEYPLIPAETGVRGTQVCPNGYGAFRSCSSPLTVLHDLLDLPNLLRLLNFQGFGSFKRQTSQDGN